MGIEKLLFHYAVPYPGLLQANSNNLNAFFINIFFTVRFFSLIGILAIRRAPGGGSEEGVGVRRVGWGANLCLSFSRDFGSFSGVHPPLCHPS